jgi:hypothetical protein
MKERRVDFRLLLSRDFHAAWQAFSYACSKLRTSDVEGYDLRET